MHKETASRIVLPSLMAGPAVLLFLVVAIWAERFTDPIVLPIELLPGVIPFLLLASVVGLLPALSANAIGTAVMTKLCASFPLLRFPLIWGVVGGSVGWAGATYYDFRPEWTFAYAATGAVSALLCRRSLA